MPPLRHRQNAFSLIELLAVLVVLGITIALTAPSLFSSQRDSRLTYAGNALVDLAGSARQAALSRNSITALILADKRTPFDRQAVALLEYNDRQAAWNQVSAWTRLPESILAIDAASDRTAVNAIAPVSIKLDGVNLTQYTGLVFFPDGRMSNATSTTRRISMRFATDDPTPGVIPKNYYDLVFNANTSALRILRP